MRFVALLMLAIILAACTAPVTMKHPKTGAVAKCGPFKTGLGADHAYREAQCIQDFKEQGFVRAN